MLERWLDRYCLALKACIALALALMVVLVFGNVVLRYAFNTGITVSEEVSRWLFVWLTFMGAVVALRERHHLGSDLVVARLPRLGRRGCAIVGLALMLFIDALVFWGSLQQARINWDVEAPVTGASVAVFYSAGILFAVSAAVLNLGDLWRVVSGRASDAELVRVTESEEATELQALQAELARQDAHEDRR